MTGAKVEDAMGTPGSATERMAKKIGPAPYEKLLELATAEQDGRVIAVLLAGESSPRRCGAPNSWCLHKAGCRDLRMAGERNIGDIKTIGPVDELRAGFNDDFGVEAGYETPWVFDRDVHFHPCVAAQRVVGARVERISNSGPAVAVGCLCGCGGTPRGKHSRFLPGHDARYYGAQRRAAKVAKHGKGTK